VQAKPQAWRALPNPAFCQRRNTACIVSSLNGALIALSKIFYSSEHPAGQPFFNSKEFIYVKQTHQVGRRFL
jgi:hypothetical protein